MLYFTHLPTLFYVIWVLLLFNFYNLGMCQASKIPLMANLTLLLQGTHVYLLLFQFPKVCFIVQVTLCLGEQCPCVQKECVVILCQIVL